MANTKLSDKRRESLHNKQVDRRKNQPGMKIEIQLDYGFKTAACVIDGRAFTIRKTITGSVVLEGVKADEETEGTFAGMVVSELLELLEKTFRAGQLLRAAEDGLEVRAGKLLNSDLWAEIPAACVEEVFNEIVG